MNIRVGKLVYTECKIYEVLKDILGKGIVKYPKDIEFIEDFLARRDLNNSTPPETLKYIRDIIFKYDYDVMESSDYTKLPVTKEDLEQAEKYYQDKDDLDEELKEENIKNYAARKVVLRYFSNLIGDIEIDKKEVIDISESYFKHENTKFAIYTTRKFYQYSIMPRRTFTLVTDIDYFVGTRYDDTDPDNHYIYIIGYLPKDKVVEYPVKTKDESGCSLTEFFDVRLVELESIDNFIKILKGEEAGVLGYNIFAIIENEERVIENVKYFNYDKDKKRLALEFIKSKEGKWYSLNNVENVRSEKITE